MSSPIASSTTVMSATDAFGPTPWVVNPTATSPLAGTFTMNQALFATQQTANTLAAMTGGSVLNGPNFFGQYASLNEPYLLVQVNLPAPNAGTSVTFDPGEVATYFNEGFSLAAVQQMIQNEIANQAKLIGLTIDPTTVSVTMPTPPPPAPVAAIMPGAFGPQILQAGLVMSPPQYEMMFPPISPAMVPAIVAVFDGMPGVVPAGLPDAGKSCTGSCRETSPLEPPPAPVGSWVVNAGQ